VDFIAALSPGLAVRGRAGALQLPRGLRTCSWNAARGKAGAMPFMADSPRARSGPLAVALNLLAVCYERPPVPQGINAGN